MDILDKLKSSGHALRRVYLGEAEIGLRILTEQDYLDAAIATQAVFKARDVDLDVGTADAYEAEKVSQLLLRIMVDPDQGRPIFKGIDALRGTLTRAEKAHLLQEYLDHEREFSPSERNMDEAAFAALLEEVKKSPETTGKDLSSSTLKRLVVTLVGQLPA